MQLARELGYTLHDLFSRTTSEELGLWLALYEEEAEQARLQSLLQRAEAARANRKKTKK
jgi:hypothetical protein